jgi:hypothetical protein
VAAFEEALGIWKEFDLVAPWLWSLGAAFQYHDLHTFPIFSPFSPTMWSELCQYRRNDRRIWSNIYSWYFAIDLLCDIRLWIDESRLDSVRTHIVHRIPPIERLNFWSLFRTTVLSMSRERKGDCEREINNLYEIMNQYRK